MHLLLGPGRKKLLYAVATLAAVGILYIYIGLFWEQSVRTNRLAETLRNANLPALTVYIDEAAYTVENGIVKDQTQNIVRGPRAYDALRVAYVFFGALITPYFSLDGTDPSRFAYEAAILFKSRDAIAQLYAPEDATTISNLYSEELLVRIPTLQESRNSFIERPSVANLDTYLSEMKEFSALYISSAQTLRNVFQTSSVDESSDFFLADGRATKQGLLSALDALRTSGIETQRNVQEFISCSYGTGERCASVLEITSIPETKAAVPIKGETFEAWELMRRAFPGRLNYTLVTLDTTSCAPQQEVAAYGTWRNASTTEARLNMRYVSDLYFWDITAQKDSTNPSFQSLIRQDIKYQYQNLTNPYICYTALADYSGVATALWARNELSTRPISRELPSVSPTVLVPLIAMEESIVRSSEVIRMEYIEAYVYALYTVVRESRSSFTTPTLARALRFIATVQQRSASADMLIQELSLYNYILRNVNGERNTESAEYTIVSRNYMYPLFFSYNRSFIQAPPRISLYEENNPLFEKLLSYRSALRQQVSAEEIENIIRKTREFYAEAARVYDSTKFIKAPQD
jgi:hypothetical protein